MNQSNFNAEAHSIIPQSCLWLHPGLITKAILTTAYVVLLIAACTVNTIVIYLVRTCKDLRQSTFNHLIINMAVADIMDVCFSTITSLSFMFVGVNWISGYGGKISCKLVCFSVSVSIGLSISTLVIMSVDRYMAIVHVMTNPISSATTKKCIALSWIVSVLVGVPCLYKMDTTESEGGSTICRSVCRHDPEEHLLYSTLEECGKVLILYLLPLILLGTTSVMIGLSLRKRRPLGYSETQERISAQNQRIFKFLVSIVVLFTFCWLFAHVNHLISVLSLSKYCALLAPVPLLFFWISHTNATINSIIYFIFNSKFRQGLREVFRVRETIPLQTRHIVPHKNFAFEGMEFAENIAITEIRRSKNQESVERDKDLEFDRKL